MLFYAHAGIRYLVLALGVLAFLWALAGVVGSRPYGRGMRVLASAFAGILHLQIVLGIGTLFTRGFYPALIGHISMMVFAAAVAQVTSSVMKRREPDARTHAPHLVGTGVALLLVVGGILAIGAEIV